MAADAIANRYAQALFEAAKAEGAIKKTREDARLIGGLMREHPELRELLYNPGVDSEDKVGVLERVLRGTWSALVRAFIAMVVSAGRSESLIEMSEAFEALVDEEEGRLRAVVRSAHPLSETMQRRLRTALEHRERKRVELHAEVAPELLGGVEVILGHRRIDGSVRRQLVELRERLSTVRVY